MNHKNIIGSRIDTAVWSNNDRRKGCICQTTVNYTQGIYVVDEQHGYTIVNDEPPGMG